MRTLVETVDGYADVEVYISTAGCLCLSNEDKEKPFFIPIEIDEAVSMAEYIIKISNEYRASKIQF
jgi:hypothetical protein